MFSSSNRLVSSASVRDTLLFRSGSLSPVRLDHELVTVSGMLDLGRVSVLPGLADLQVPALQDKAVCRYSIPRVDKKNITGYEMLLIDGNLGCLK